MTNEEIAKAAFLRLESSRISRVAPHMLPTNPVRMYTDSHNLFLFYADGQWVHLAVTCDEEQGDLLYVQSFNRNFFRLYEQAGMISRAEMAEIQTYLEKNDAVVKTLTAASTLVDHLKRHPELKIKVLEILDGVL